MIKQRKRTTKYLLAVLAAALAVLCTAGLLLTLYENKSRELTRLQNEAIALLDARKGEYDTQKIVLRNTSVEEAQGLAERFGAALRITQNGEFATLTLPEGVGICDIYAKSENRELIGSMSPDFFMQTADLTPARPNYSVSDTEYEKQSYLDYINIDKTWEASKGEGVTVAVIDTGIDTDHPEFAGKISEYSYNATKDKSVKEYGDWSLVEDTQGHGTAVCGVISAGMDGVGTVGIAPEAQLLVIKAESNSVGGFYRSSDIVFGIYYAIEQGADVINMSFSGDENNTKEAVRLAAECGIICVAAAGNNATVADCYPAADDNVIGVGALAKDSYELAAYSNYGNNTTLVSAGTVYTTAIGGTYAEKEGTSFACPAVSAAVALYLSKNKEADLSDIIAELKISSTDLGNDGCDSLFGYGLLDVGALVCEERGTLTLDTRTEELNNASLSFVRNKALQTIPIPEREGYVFDGWYYDAELTKPLKLYYDIFTSDLTLYAGWSKTDSSLFKYVEREDGTVMVTAYTGNEKNVAVPAKIDDKAVTAIGGTTFVMRTDIESISIPSSVNLLNGTVFFGASSVQSFSISGGESESFGIIDGVLFDKSEKTLVAYPAGKEGEYDIPIGVRYIGPCAFACAKISGIDLTGISTIGSHAFANAQLESLSIPYAVSFVDRYAFAANTNLKTLRLGRSTVSVSEYAFAYCDNLKTLSIPAGVLEIRKYAFYQNTSLQTVEFERNCSLSIIEEGAFAECAIKALAFPQTMVSIAEKAFYKNAELAKVDFAEGCRLFRIDARAFEGCASLCELTLSTQLEKIGEKAFCNTAITSVSLPDSLVYLGSGAFAECTALKDILVGDESTLYTSVDGVLYNADKTSILAYPAGRTQSEYTLIGTATAVDEAAFRGAKNLKKVNLPSTLSFIGREAFSSSGLTEVNITDNIAHIGAYAFSGLKELKKFEVSETHEKYASVDGMLCSKDGERLIAVPSSMAGELTLSDRIRIIDFGAFESSELLRINIPDGVQLIAADAFKNSTAVIYCREGTAAHGYAESNLDSYFVYNEATPTPPTLYAAGETTVTLVSHKGYEYRLDGGEWQSSNIFTGLERNTEYTFYQREAQADHKEASEESVAASFTTLDHSFGEVVEGVDANCEHEGRQAYYLCENCGEYFTADKEQTTKEKLTIAKKDHSYGEDDICDICKYNRAESTETTDIQDSTEPSGTSEKPTEPLPSKSGCKAYALTAPLWLVAVIAVGVSISARKKDR